MRNLGQKRTIHVKGYRWGFARSLYNTKQDNKQIQTKLVKCRSGQVHVGSLLQLKMWYEKLIAILLKSFIERGLVYATECLTNMYLRQYKIPVRTTCSPGSLNGGVSVGRP